MKGHWRFKQWNIPGGCLAAPHVMWKFSVSLWHWCLFSIGSIVLWGENRLQRHSNTKITDLGPCLKFMKRFQCPCVSLCHDRAISVIYFTAKGVGKRFYSCFFFSFYFFFFLNNYGFVFGPEILLYIPKSLLICSEVMNLLKLWIN